MYSYTYTYMYLYTYYNNLTPNTRASKHYVAWLNASQVGPLTKIFTLQYYDVGNDDELLRNVTDISVWKYCFFGTIFLGKGSKKNPIKRSGWPLGSTPHSGPGGRRINLSKCTKNQTKWNIFTLTIAFHKNGINFNESFKKNDFRPKNTFFTLSMVTLANCGQ